MRILAVTPYYRPEGGGLEVYAHSLMSRLVQRGHEVRALAFTRGEPREEVLDGVSVARLRAWGRISNTPVDPTFAARVTRELRATRADLLVVHTPVPFPAEAASWAARRAGIPYVVTYHAGRLEGGSAVLKTLAWLDRMTTQRAMLAHAAHLIAVGAYVRDHPLAEWRHKVTLVPPGVDAEVFRPNGPPHGRDVLFVAPLDRAYRWKGLDVLWTAMRRVRREDPEARLVLVGTGDRLEEFRQRARHEGWNGSVVLRGPLPIDGLVKAYQESRVTVLPSTTPSESFGMVLAEANACARPVVASRVGGIPDFVRDGDNGLLAEPGDPEDLAERILEVLGDPGRAQRLGMRGRDRVVREHDWRALTVQTERVLEGAAG